MTADPLALQEALRRALDGGPAVDLAAWGASAADTRRAPPTACPPGVAMIVPTSGTTGEPKSVGLSAGALCASADATHAALGGPGRWLLALPIQHVAGAQVLVRSLSAGTDPVTLPAGEPFTAERFAQAARRALAGDTPAYTALVPTQVARVLGDDAAAALLARFDAVLVGGAAMPYAVAEAALDRRVRIVRTYGMSETAGGCVYDGQALPGSAVRVGQDGLVSVGGATLAEGYLTRDGTLDTTGFSVADDGMRWFLTSDIGLVRPDGLLEVLGRADDVIVTGGHKVRPEVVRRALLALDGVLDAFVVGVPDPQWGHAVGAVLVWRDPTSARTGAQVRAAVAGLPAYARPWWVVAAPDVPLTALGKPDRPAARRLLLAGGRIDPDVS
jgi:O-succinylbenzoic acid--CoA ligase